MKVICVDDEPLLLEEIVEMCRELPEISEVNGFTRARHALDWLLEHPVDLALLDIDLPGMNGLTLASKIKNYSPNTAVIFLSASSQYAVDAFAVRASGYLLKPIIKEELAENVSYVCSNRGGTGTPKKRW